MNAIDQAAELGAESFVILSGKDPGEENRELAYRHLANSIELLADYSERRGISTFWKFLTGAWIRKHSLDLPRKHSNWRIISAMEYPEFGLLYDMGHMPLLDEVPQTALPILAPHLREVHLGNCVKNPTSPSLRR